MMGIGGSIMRRGVGWKKATGAVAKTSELSSSGMEIEIAELLYGLMTFKKEKIQKKIRNKSFCKIKTRFVLGI
ncbi:hypothetical protein P8452_16926 [Trifolium repens]|nr:hypothetical protein P8452_16926 [Trifolium repens]